MMKKILCLCLLLFPSHVLGKAQPDISYSKTVTLEIREEKNGKHSLTASVLVENRYLSERSLFWKKFSIHEPYYKEVVKLKATYNKKKIARGNISTRFAEPANIFLVQHLTHEILFSQALKPGDVAAYRYKEKYQDIVFASILEVPNVDRVEEYKVIVEHPSSIAVDFDLFFPRERLKHTIGRKRSDRTVLRFHDLPDQGTLSHFPFNHVAAAILPRFSENGKNLNALNPGEFSDWYLDLLGGEPTLKEEDRSLLRDQLEATERPLERLRILYDFVRENIRYIASYEHTGYSILPHAPSLVLERRYGDCKDKAYLLAALARANGIKVNMVALATEPNPVFEGLHTDLYDHIICAYVDDEGHHFFDPSCKYCEFGNLPDQVIGAQAFLFDREKPERLVIPSPNQRISLEVEIQVEEDVKNGVARITLRNDFFTTASRAHRELQGIDLENLLASLITERLNKILLDDFQYRSCGEDFIAFDARADISDFAIATAKKMYFPQAPFQIVDADVLHREGDDFTIYIPYRPKAKLTLEIPLRHYDCVQQYRELGNKRTAMFKASVTPEGERARICYEVEQHTRRFEGDSKTQYIAFCRQYLKSKSKMFAFTRRDP